MNASKYKSLQKKIEEKMIRIIIAIKIESGDLYQKNIQGSPTKLGTDEFYYYLQNL